MPDGAPASPESQPTDLEGLARRASHIPSDRLVLVGPDSTISASRRIAGIPAEPPPTLILPSSPDPLIIPTTTAPDTTRLQNGLYATGATEVGEITRLPSQPGHTEGPQGLHIVSTTLAARAPKEMIEKVTLTKNAREEDEAEELRRKNEQFKTDKDLAQREPAVFLHKLITRNGTPDNPIQEQILLNLKDQHNTHKHQQPEYSHWAIFANLPNPEGVIETTQPPLEHILLQGVTLVKDAYVASLGENEELLHSLNTLFRDYRVKTVNNLPLYFPELQRNIVDILENPRTSKGERNEIYDMLGQLVIPLEQQEKLLFLMEQYGDYANNFLAARYAWHMYEGVRDGYISPDNPWIKAQETRREELRELLKQSPEELLKIFPTLMKKANRIVFASNPLTLPDGKIGFEYEGKRKREDIEQKISVAWDVGQDGDYTEIRKDENHLQFSDYPADLIDLDTWVRDHYIGDNRKPHQRSTMHIHLDKDKHPNLPIGEVYEVDYNHHETWEQRSFMPFLSPAQTLAAIETLIHAAKENRPLRKRLSSESLNGWQDMVFGYLCTQIKNPAGRRAALIALQDPVSMRGFDIKPFFNFYDSDLIKKFVSDLDAFVIPSSEDGITVIEHAISHDIDIPIRTLFNVYVQSEEYEKYSIILPFLAKDPNYTPYIIEQLSDPDLDYGQKTGMVEGLTKSTEGRAICTAYLIGPRRGPDAAIRSDMINYLAGTEEVNAILPDLLLGPQRDPSESVRSTVLQLISRNPDFQPITDTMLFGEKRDTSATIREQLVEMYSRDRGKHESLLQLLDGPLADPSSFVKIAVINELSLYPTYTKKFADMLFSNYTEKDSDEYIRSSLITAVLKDPSYKTQLMDILFTPELPITDSATEKLLSYYGHDKKYSDKIYHAFLSTTTVDHSVQQEAIYCLRNNPEYYPRFAEMLPLAHFSTQTMIADALILDPKYHPLLLTVAIDQRNGTRLRSHILPMLAKNPDNLPTILKEYNTLGYSGREGVFQAIASTMLTFDQLMGMINDFQSKNILDAYQGSELVRNVIYKWANDYKRSTNYEDKNEIESKLLSVLESTKAYTVKYVDKVLETLEDEYPFIINHDSFHDEPKYRKQILEKLYHVITDKKADNERRYSLPSGR